MADVYIIIFFFHCCKVCECFFFLCSLLFSLFAFGFLSLCCCCTCAQPMDDRRNYAIHNPSFCVSLSFSQSVGQSVGSCLVLAIGDWRCECCVPDKHKKNRAHFSNSFTFPVLPSLSPSPTFPPPLGSCMSDICN